MKATLGIEAIGGIPQHFPKTGIEIIDTTFDPGPPRFWVARITGYYGTENFKREFLYGKRDYSKSNSKGTRGIFVWYVLESGGYYEVSSPHSWHSIERYFCKVSEDGEIVRVDRNEVDVWCMREVMRKAKEKRDGQRQQTNDGD
ncbi:MAG: hypothetical protein A4E42_00229 [Methanoregulaceae archaeon PtaU1.Bin222]|nr:MAG: hypothetical protein A4E42_00229 [Methanoregulaceae archaeon PtaU1.Bin222]